MQVPHSDPDSLSAFLATEGVDTAFPRDVVVWLLFGERYQDARLKVVELIHVVVAGSVPPRKRSGFIGDIHPPPMRPPARYSLNELLPVAYFSSETVSSDTLWLFSSRHPTSRIRTRASR